MNNNKLEILLKCLIDRKKELVKPVMYQEEDWYIRCEAKADMLQEVIEEVTSLMKKET
jgi:hypothetical protein